MTGVGGLAALALLLTTACDSATGPEGTARVDIRFGTSGVAGGVSGAAPASGISARGLVVQGTNGILDIEEVRLIVAELELEGDDDACESAGQGDDCAEFEAPAFFLDLPLDGGRVTVATDDVPLGLYDELEFEVEDLEDDDAGDLAVIQRIFNEVRSEFPDWPEEASMLVTGTFTPTGGQPVAFRVYFEAEIEVEMELSPPLRISEEGASRSVVVEVRPEAWFLRPDGTVLDLSRFDFDRTGAVVEFEVEMEHGFTRIELD